MALSLNDPNSFSNPEECKVTDFVLRLNVNFQTKTLKGTIEIKVKRFNDASKVILDTRDLTIHKIIDKLTGRNLDFVLGKTISCFGASLTITLPKDDGAKNLDEFSMVIEYETSPNSTALQWLTPEQTSGKVHPYLFSHSEAIHSRSMFPCQDTPSVKTPYSAEITSPKELTVLMSALRENEEQSPESEALKITSFKQPVPIPSYLVALVVGALESRDIGPRCHVWAEKEVVDKAAYEFAETEEMLQTAESLVGPYIWGVYDLLVLPPSFPFGGMENPCLTFVTPTLLAGDRSQAAVVAHEIAHSWTGNLVTNANFEHFWLNEGFTVFLERKVVGRMKGEPHRHLEAIGGWNDLQDTINSRGSNDPLTKLVPSLKGIDPDDAFSTVPYEKGHTLLFYLENLLGGPKAFEPFLRAYVSKFQYKSIITEDWKNFLYEFFKEKKDVLDSVDWKAWLDTPGMPPVHPDFDSSLEKQYLLLAEQWLSADNANLSQFSFSDVEKLSSHQLQGLLAHLLLQEPLSVQKMEKMTECYNLKSNFNSEIRFRWLRLGIRAHWKEAVGPALAFVTEQGRMKFVRPIYRDLYAWEEVRPRAIQTFKDNEKSYMYVTASTVMKDLHLI